MDYRLTEEQKLIVESVRRITKEKISPLVEEVDRKGEFPWKVHKILLENGFVGLCLPREYGGGGLDLLTFSMVAEELAKRLLLCHVLVKRSYHRAPLDWRYA